MKERSKSPEYKKQGIMAESGASRSESSTSGVEASHAKGQRVIKATKGGGEARPRETRKCGEMGSYPLRIWQSVPRIMLTLFEKRNEFDHSGRRHMVIWQPLEEDVNNTNTQAPMNYAYCSLQPFTDGGRPVYRTANSDALRPRLHDRTETPESHREPQERRLREQQTTRNAKHETHPRIETPTRNRGGTMQPHRTPPARG